MKKRIFLVEFWESNVKHCDYSGDTEDSKRKSIKVALCNDTGFDDWVIGHIFQREANFGFIKRVISGRIII